MIANGANPWLATLTAFFVGAIGGLITGLLNTKLKINGLLAGIITLTAFFSINLVILGINSDEPFSFASTYSSFRTLKVTVGEDPTIFGLLGNLFSVRKYGVLIELTVILLIILALLYFFFGTEVGMSMRAAGMNKKMARAQGINTDFYVILGLMISNGLIALSAALGAQRDYTISSVSGTGMIVVGLASIIIGEALFGKRSFKNWLISVVLGAIVYYFIIAIALYLGFPSHLLKLLYAILIVLILVLGFLKEKYHWNINLIDRFASLFDKKKKDTDEELPELSIEETKAPNIIKDSNGSTSMLQVKNVKKVFNPSGNKEDIKVALNDVSIDIKEGEFVTIIGGNGSGKSTFINTVSGVYIPEEGIVEINGVDVTKEKEYKRSKYIGRVAQDPYQGTAQNMSVLENMNIAYKRNTKKTLKWGFNKGTTLMFKERLQELNLGLENRLNAKIGLLSGGQRQAVTLLMATIKKPDILFLDEHTAALDPKTASKVLDLTDSIVKNNNLTCVMVTHNMKDAIKYGNRLLMFNNGKIIYDVSGEEKQNLTVEALLKKFEDVDFNDSDVLA